MTQLPGPVPGARGTCAVIGTYQQPVPNKHRPDAINAGTGKVPSIHLYVQCPSKHCLPLSISRYSVPVCKQAIEQKARATDISH